MKMNKTLLLKASAFFLLITLLFSCGIPTYFYVNYEFIKGSGLASDTVTGEFKFTDTYDNFSWIISGTGPSVMLSYIVTSSPSIPSFNSLFSSTYKNKRSSNNGVAVEDDALLTYDSGGYTYTLHRFSDENGTEFDKPHYTAYDNNHSALKIKIILTKTNDNFMNLVITDGNDTSPTYPYLYSGSQRLARFDGSTFLDSFPSNTSNYPDYTILSEPEGLYCHVFAAVNVSQGLFTNNFWTDLKHLGYIQLN